MQLNDGEVPVRFAITKTDEENHIVELGVLFNDYETWNIDNPCIFDYHQHRYKRSNDFNIALVIPYDN